jgi:hypothetical protein
MRIHGILPPLALLLAAFSAGHAGDDPLKEWAEDKKLAKKIVLYPHASANAVKKLKESGFAAPKKVGLISFYLWDVGEYKFNAMANAYGGTYERTSQLTPKGANHFATKLAELGVPALKKAFAAHGMDLLEPVDFISTEEQRQAYVTFQLPTGKLGGATLAVADWMQKNPKASSAAAGYSGINTHLWMDAKGLTALEDLRQKLGLDAMVVLANTSNSDAKEVRLDGIQLSMYGHNPVPIPAMKIAQIAWSPGAPYAQGMFGKGFQGTVIAEMKKGEVKAEFYEGYDVILETLADESLKVFDEQYGK